MIDAHCHLEYLHEQLDDIVAEARQKGMRAILTSACDPKHFAHAMEMKSKHPDFIFVCIGFHPEVMGSYTDEQIGEYMNEIRKSRDNITAIGEIGLDYNWNTQEADQERSRKIFVKFIDLAKELELPIVVHSRNGTSNENGGNEGITDALNMLAEHGAERVMMHCFSGNEKNLKFALDHGWNISYATVLVKSFKHQRLAAATPLDKMLLETDAPWLDPDSRELVNRPWKIGRSAEIIAEKKGTTKDEILAATANNARKFFGIYSEASK